MLRIFELIGQLIKWLSTRAGVRIILCFMLWVLNLSTNNADEGSRCDDLGWTFLQLWWKCSYWPHCHGLIRHTRHIYTRETSMMLLKAPSLKKLLQVFCRKKDIHYAPKLSSVALIGYMSERQYNHSGWTVIIPSLSLYTGTVYTTAAMLVEFLDGYDDSYIALMSLELRHFP